MKYVICVDRCLEMIGTPRWPRGGQSLGPSHHQHALVFTDGFTHAEVVERLRLTYPGMTPTSAGFVVLCGDGSFRCSGRSDSLNLDSDPELDAFILAGVMKP